MGSESTRRVLLISGSLQERSANRAVLDVARVHLRGLGHVEVDEASEVAAIPAFNPDEDDPAPSAVTAFRARMAAADAVLVATPEYAAGVPGALKNALDWVVGSGELYATPVALLSAGTSGGPHAREHLARSLTWQGAHIVGQLGIAAPRPKSDDAGRIVDPDTIDAIEAVARQLVDAIGMTADDRLALVGQVTASLGIEPGHIAPVPR